MYMPKLARFTARDPLSENGADLLGGLPRSASAHAVNGPMSTHPYAYVDNNPVNFVEPSGKAVDVDVFNSFLQPPPPDEETDDDETAADFDDCNCGEIQSKFKETLATDILSSQCASKDKAIIIEIKQDVYRLCCCFPTGQNKASSGCGNKFLNKIGDSKITIVLPKGKTCTNANKNKLAKQALDVECWRKTKSKTRNSCKKLHGKLCKEKVS